MYWVYAVYTRLLQLAADKLYLNNYAFYALRLNKVVCLIVIVLSPKLWYKDHQILYLTVVFAQPIEAMCWFENGDVVGAAPTGDTSTTYE